MSQTAGKTHNLDDEGGEESLRALIRSIVPDAATNSNGKYSADIVDKLAEKLTELLGPDAFQEPTLDQARRNDKGELVNEDGLPIIEINEHADATQFQYTNSRPAPITVEPLLPLANLPPPAREQLRARRNRILDQLEEEERNAELAEEQREQQEEQEQKEAAAHKRAQQDQDHGAAADKAKAARELQKKMGRALIQNVGKAREQERVEQEAQRIRDEEADKRRASPNIKKKTVAFVDSPEAKLKDDDDADNGRSSSPRLMDWGDLAPGRLRSMKHPTLMTPSLLDKHPMKMKVVERIPGGTPTMAKLKTPATPAPRIVDSDDESEPEEPWDSDTEIDDENENEEEAALDKDAVDLDYARIQREIALEYYQKRNQIGEAAASAMMNHTHDEDERIPTEPELRSESSKPAISQFRANKLATAYNISTNSGSQPAASSTSLGASVLPASSTRTIQKAIRTGKLDDDGKLIGGEDDSASEEEDQGIQEVLELLRKGEVYNLGPDGKYIHAVRPNPNLKQGSNNFTPSPSSAESSVPGPSSSSPTAASLPPPAVRPKVSKFKADRTAAGRPGPSSLSIAEPTPQLNLSDIRSPSVTPVSHAGRSSPKMDTSTVTVPVATAPSTIRSPVPTKPPAQLQPQPQSQPSPFSMIVESPSFPNLNRAGGSRAREHEYPYDTELAAINAEPAIGGPNRGAGSQPRRLQRPPTVVASTVLERKPAGKPLSGATSQRGGDGDADTPQAEKKISRFMAGRK
ncbi:hypothetical protein D9619_005372 [Psilocybe cf. subviscida]|uniref:DUF3835 domain-containing protein n=1 Tax=Psilocybe cf. subviscida TaxID=2480587 RepID=A0A8H5FBV0_9AGAR|nr:hypothetical protein D9619_005372 [Psilocybe cf. subviscida]